jgi:precorrin isomerase
MPIEYERDAAAIYRASFAIIRREANLEHLSPLDASMLVRMMHACGMTDLAADVEISPGAAEVGRSALRAGAAVLCDSGMVAAGITRHRLPSNNAVRCMLHAPNVPALAARLGTTRSAAALECCRDEMGGSLVVIGNAPTALFHLLDMLAGGAPRPALILGLPVGFVGAAESKMALARNTLNVPYVTLHGRRGGSAIAAAAVNALAADDT